MGSRCRAAGGWARSRSHRISATVRGTRLLEPFLRPLFEGGGCHRCQEGVREHRQGDVAVPADVAADFVLVQAALVHRGLEALLDGPPCMRPPEPVRAPADSRSSAICFQPTFRARTRQRHLSAGSPAAVRHGREAADQGQGPQAHHRPGGPRASSWRRSGARRTGLDGASTAVWPLPIVLIITPAELISRASFRR